MDEIKLTAEQEVEAAAIEDILRAKSEVEIRKIARLLASRADGELFGQTEYEIRDAVHRLGAAGIDAALNERKKRGTADRAPSVRTAGKTHASRAIGGAP